MRTASTLLHYSTDHLEATTKATFPPPVTIIQRSPWQYSAVVYYVLGGLGVVLGLIAFALLVLACSCFKLSDQVNADEEGGAAAEKGESSSATKASPVFDQKFLVIMAAQVKPTFLATPMSIKGASSFNRQQIYTDEKVATTEQSREGNAESQGSQ